MKKYLLFFPFLLFACTIHAQQKGNNGQPWTKHGRLMVSKEDPHFLGYEDGTPFFWLGDTGWEMLHLLNRQEIAHYLDVRKHQGFNVIQTVALSEFGGLTKPNAYGALPFKNSDPGTLQQYSKPAAKNAYTYWDHVDYAVNEAEKRGMFLALLPCWGEYVIPREGHGIFKTEKQAYDYGHFFGARYKTKKNIIWILGGDRLPDEIPGGIALWRAMAKGIADGTNGKNDRNGKTDYSTTLMTYHCFESSSKWFREDEWLDMDMWGSYHDNFNNTRAFEQVYADDSLKIIKPTLNGEPAYEEHPVNWLPENGEFKAYDVRQIAYWSVFAGACGHTYGNASVWQFYDPKRKSTYDAHTPWPKALLDDGAKQMIWLKQLIESRPMIHRKAAQNLIISGQLPAGDHCIATKGTDYAFIYLPAGKPVTVKVEAIAPSVNAWWFDPRNGNTIFIGEYKNQTEVQFAPPAISKTLAWLKTGRGCDWVLVIDDVRANYKAPGQIY